MESDADRFRFAGWPEPKHEGELRAENAALRAVNAALRAVLREIRSLPTYNVSQGICINSYPERLLKAAAVHEIIDRALLGEK